MEKDKKIEVLKEHYKKTNDTYPTKKIIFLDYDGVINTAFYEKSGKEYPIEFSIPFDIFRLYNTVAIERLNDFAKKHHAVIVVTSSWRSDPRYKDYLYESGLDKSIVIEGCTSEGMNRQSEIYDYLFNHPDFYSFVIFDDMVSLGMMKPWFVKTNAKVGITEKDIKKADKILSQPFVFD